MKRELNWLHIVYFIVAVVIENIFKYNQQEHLAE